MSQRKKRNKRAPKRGKSAQPSTASNHHQEDLIQTVEAVTRALQDGEAHTARRLVEHLQENHPDHYRTYSFRAQVALWDGDKDEAVRLSREAMSRGGDSVLAVVAHHADILESHGLHEEALEVLESKAAQWSDQPKLIRIRAQALRGLHRRAEARDLLEGHIAAGVDFPSSQLNDLAMLLFDLGDKQGGMEYIRKALEKDPQYNVLWSNLLMLAHYRPDMSLAEIDDIYREWREACIDHLPRNTEFQRDATPDRPLRIGFVSNGFLSHPAGWMSITGMRFLSDYFDHELFLYSIREGPSTDPVASRFREIATRYTNIAGWSHQEVHDRLLEDELDLLVEMAGHSERNVLPAVARRVAPVQIKWVGGLFDTSALPTMDYLLTDAVETPPGSEYRYTEQFIRLPGGYVSYTGPTNFPDVNQLPALQGEPFTFGCLNNFHKFNETVAELWSSILTAVPDSRLLLKDRQLSDPGIRQWALELFAHFGIDSDRLILEGGSPHRQLLETYNRIDVALDPWPYTGGLTTVEALMMGVPVITCPSETFAGRHAASHLQNVGLGDFIARDFSQYRALAISCSREKEAINQLRQSLRSMVRKAPLSQYLQFSTNLDTAFRTAWGRWCRGEPAAPIDFPENAPIPENVLERGRSDVEAHREAVESDPRRIIESSIPQVDRPAIFVTGLSRSGTTLMQGLLSNSPATIGNTRECSYFRGLIEAYLRSTSPGFDFHARDYFPEPDDLRRFHRGLCESYFEVVQERFGPGLLLQKEPRLLTVLPELADLMPRSAFVVMARDPRDVLASQLRRLGSVEDWQTRFQFLAGMLKAFLDRNDSYNERVFFVRYEHLITEPRRTLAAIEERLQRAGFPRMGLDAPEIPLEWDNRRPGEESSTALDGLGPDPDNFGRFRQTLTTEQIAFVEDHAELFRKTGAEWFLETPEELAELPSTWVLEPGPAN